MNWEALVAAAVLVWGLITWPITVLEETEPPRPGVLANTTFDGEICFIHVYPSHWAAEYDPQFIVTHEVGHCLAIPHIDQPGIMNRFYAPGTEFSGYDRAEFWHHYPAPYRIAVPMVGQ